VGAARESYDYDAPSLLKSISKMRIITVAISVFLFGTITVRAQTEEPRNTAQQPSAAEKYFTNTELVTQDGKRVRFYADVLKGKVVVINSFFSTCQGSCMPMNRNFKKVADLLGDRVGRDVFLVSITVDSQMDTPTALKKYANSLHAPTGWVFLTGTKENVDFVLHKLGHYVSDKNDHLNIMIVGNERTGLWKKAFGLAPANELAKVVESVIDDKPTTAP
jgi:protein SCO1/2